MNREEDHRSLVRAVNDGKIEVGVDVIRLNRSDSPVYKWTDHNLPAFVLAGIVAYVFYAFGQIWGFVGLSASIVAFFWPVRKWGFAKLKYRTREMALSSLDGWETLWRFGGLSVRRGAEEDSQCVSPNDDWHQFMQDCIDLQKYDNPGENKIARSLLILGDTDTMTLKPAAIDNIEYGAAIPLLLPVGRKLDNLESSEIKMGIYQAFLQKAKEVSQSGENLSSIAEQAYSDGLITKIPTALTPESMAEAIVTRLSQILGMIKLNGTKFEVSARWVDQQNWNDQRLEDVLFLLWASLDTT